LADGPRARTERPLAGIAAALRSRAYRAAASANLADGFAVMGVRSAIVPLFVRDVLREPPTWTGIGFLVVAVLNAATLLPGGKVADTLGRRPVIVAGCLASGVSMVLLAVLPGLWGISGFLVALGALGLGSGLLDVAPSAMIGDLLGGSRGGNGGQGGTVVASYQMAGDIGTVTGPVAVGFLVDSVSYAAAFVLAAGVLGLAAVAGIFAPETRKPHPPEAERIHISETAGAQPHCDPA
ncbi:MAG TPA: MFS transporter, partial [Streptosporangiaceae bacterium]|nr:MFS transporter [Streptosporangiaceae bacterium]